MNVAVLGASGVVGRNLLPRLIEAGHRVRAGMRHRGPATNVDGVEQIEANILERSTLTRLVAGADALINLASSIPRADGSGGDWATYDRIRREGTKNAISVCDQAAIPLIAQSIAMLHCSRQTSVQDEQSPMQASGAADDEPMRQSELCDIVADLCGQRRGAPGTGAESVMPGFRVSNAALRALGWAPRYASVRSGLVATAERYRTPHSRAELRRSVASHVAK
jgi:nucleoside-diphosphate-sugar epimerase